MDRDIFGYPIVPPGERRGRPSHQPTKDSRLIVAVMVARYRRHDEIAAALNIDAKTLRKRYRHELDRGRDQVRAELDFQCMRKVQAGDVGAMRLMYQRLEQADLEQVRRDFDGATPPEPPPAPRPGKKELAQLAAEQAGEGTEWGEDLAFTGGGLKS